MIGGNVVYELESDPQPFVKHVYQWWFKDLPHTSGIQTFHLVVLVEHLKLPIGRVSACRLAPVRFNLKLQQLVFSFLDWNRCVWTEDPVGKEITMFVFSKMGLSTNGGTPKNAGWFWWTGQSHRNGFMDDKNGGTPMTTHDYGTPQKYGYP